MNEQNSNTTDTAIKKTAVEDLTKDLTIGLPSPLKLLNESILLFRKKFINFTILTSVTLVPLFILSFIPDLLKFESNFSNNIYIVVYLYISIFTFSLMFLALLYAVKNNEENIGVLNCYKIAFKGLTEYWKILLFVFILVSIGKFFFLLPGIIMTVWFSISLMVFMVEEVRGVDALLVSKYYVQGYWSSVFLRILFLIFIAFLLITPLYTFLIFDMPIIYFEIYLLIILLFFLPITATYLFLIYGNLRLLKGNSGELIEALHKTNSLKLKLKLLKPAFIEGAIIGIPISLLIINLYVFRIYKLSDNSMEPNFQKNAIVTVNLFYKNINDYKRGDIVYIQSPDEKNKVILKRIIAIPNDTLTIVNGEVIVNNYKIDESGYIKDLTYTRSSYFIKENDNLRIPSQNYIVLNDNREILNDSRAWGFIREDEIIGIAGKCIWNCKGN